jgi:Putative zinc-finger
VCPDAALLASYADNGLSADERRRVEAHAADCATCLEHLTLLGAISVERDTPEPSQLWLARWGWLVPVATAVLVVAVWTRLPDQERSGTTPAARATFPQAAVPERESAAAAPDTTASYSALRQPRTATKVGQMAEATRPAQLPDAKVEPLERRDVARQYAAKAPPAVASAPPGALPVQAQEAGAERAVPLFRGATDKVASPKPSAAAAAPAADNAMNEEVKLAESGRRRESDQLMSKAAAAPPLVVSASPKESYRAAANRIELSEDGGATWRVVASALRVTLTAAACAPGGPCWFGTSDGAILRRTPDGFPLSRLPVPVRVVAIAPDGSQTAVVTVESGARFRTADGGATWQPIP